MRWTRKFTFTLQNAPLTKPWQSVCHRNSWLEGCKFALSKLKAASITTQWTLPVGMFTMRGAMEQYLCSLFTRITFVPYCQKTIITSKWLFTPTAAVCVKKSCGRAQKHNTTITQSTIWPAYYSLFSGVTLPLLDLRPTPLAELALTEFGRGWDEITGTALELPGMMKCVNKLCRVQLMSFWKREQKNLRSPRVNLHR